MFCPGGEVSSEGPGGQLNSPGKPAGASGGQRVPRGGGGGGGNFSSFVHTF